MAVVRKQTGSRSEAAIGELPGMTPAPPPVAQPKRAPRAKSTKNSSSRFDWRIVTALIFEIGALAASALIVVMFALGRLADWFTGDSFWRHSVPFAGGLLVVLAAIGGFIYVWWRIRKRLADLTIALPPALALGVLAGAVWGARQPEFTRDVSNFQTLIGGSVEVERLTIAHQVYAAYRRADLSQQLIILERARVYEPTVIEAAQAFKLDPEVLIGVGATESSYFPRTSGDGGQGLFQITKPPTSALTDAKKKLGVEKLDPVNQRHNAFVGAATLRRYLNEMKGDLFLGLLAYNIGPKNGGLVSIMQKYGARDFVTIQPYLKNLPRDYPIRVLSAALAYRLWKHDDGKLPRYEEGDNAVRIQTIGIPGLDLAPKQPEVGKAKPKAKS